MSKMNFNGKKETAEKNECQNNEEATNLQQEQENAAVAATAETKPAAVKAKMRS